MVVMCLIGKPETEANCRQLAGDDKVQNQIACMFYGQIIAAEYAVKHPGYELNEVRCSTTPFPEEEPT